MKDKRKTKMEKKQKTTIKGIRRTITGTGELKRICENYKTSKIQLYNTT